PIPCYRVERRDQMVAVVGRAVLPAKAPMAGRAPSSIVIVGAGAAGHAAAEMLRREGYRGRVLLFGAEPTVPVDRPNLSKDYLAGTAPDEWIPLRPREFFAEQEIELHTGARVVDVEASAQRVRLEDGRTFRYERLLLATGAKVVRLAIPGGDAPHLFYLRTLADSQAIIARAALAKSAAVIGASFIGLEVAASLRSRGLEVQVVAPESVPLERVMGAELGGFVRKLHEDKGVKFHLGRRPAAIEADGVVLDDGTRLGAELVVAGVGVRPAVELAEIAGCRTDRGVLVDERLQTSVPGIFAAGDLARFPDGRAGGSMRIEHWVVAQRMGQVAARAMLGHKVVFDAVPFFWSQHYDVPIAYVGHAEEWDQVTVHGSIEQRSCVVAFRQDGRVLAAASIFRDRESLQIEAALQRNDQAAVERILAAVK
ncbi:MAG TPA: FAD-dependent oxidoreductase, partial [Kofleriaceae bacterium]|nr:FAD-dependent oxidoreductase [Kofleriaceae bacterium]